MTLRLAKLSMDIPADEIYRRLKVLDEKREGVKKELETLTLNSDIGLELKDYNQLVEWALLWFNQESTSEMKEKIIKKLVARIEIDTDSVEVPHELILLIKDLFRFPL